MIGASALNIRCAARCLCMLPAHLNADCISVCILRSHVAHRIAAALFHSRSPSLASALTLTVPISLCEMRASALSALLLDAIAARSIRVASPLTLTPV